MLARTLCSLATATPNKDVTPYATLTKTVLLHRHASDQKNCQCSHPNTLSLIVFAPEHLVLRRVRTRTLCASSRSQTEHVVLRGCVRAFVLERTIQNSHRLCRLKDTCGRLATRAIPCRSRPLCPASKSKESFIKLDTAFQLLLR